MKRYCEYCKHDHTSLEKLPVSVLNLMRDKENNTVKEGKMVLACLICGHGAVASTKTGFVIHETYLDEA